MDERRVFWVGPRKALMTDHLASPYRAIASILRYRLYGGIKMWPLRGPHHSINNPLSFFPSLLLANMLLKNFTLVNILLI